MATNGFQKGQQLFVAIQRKFSILEEELRGLVEDLPIDKR